MYQSIRNITFPLGSREFDIMNLLSGGEFESKSLICMFLPVSSLYIVDYFEMLIT